MSTTPKARPSELSPMPTGSSASVRIFWLDREGTLQRLRTAVKDLVEEHPEIEQAIVFGSLARGDAVPGSDVDLLLILQASELPFLERSVRYRPAGMGIGVDVFAYTREELDAMLEAGNSFLAQALREGISLFGE